MLSVAVAVVDVVDVAAESVVADDFPLVLVVTWVRSAESGFNSQFNKPSSTIVFTYYPLFNSDPNTLYNGYLNNELVWYSNGSN